MQIHSYAPHPSLADIVAYHFTITSQGPADREVTDYILPHLATVAILLKGSWATAADSDTSHQNGIALLGSSSIALQIRVQGEFSLLGIALKPAGWRALFSTPAWQYVDQLHEMNDLWGDGANQLHERILALDPADHRAMLEVVEQALLTRVRRSEYPKPDRAMLAFEKMIFRADRLLVRDVAETLGITSRRLERQSKEHFGLTPKVLLRRSRFFDMAATLRRFAPGSEEQSAAIQYYDQSHCNREFRHFINMTPGQFVAARTPLFDATLALRQQYHEGQHTAPPPAFHLSIPILTPTAAPPAAPQTAAHDEAG